MPSRSFPSKFPGTKCVRCGKEVEIGAEIMFAAQGSKDKVHANACPGTAPPNSPPPTVSPPAPASGDQPIYTYHRRASTGPNVNDWIEWGVSTRGRPPEAVNIDNVDYLTNAGVRDADRRERRLAKARED